MKELVEVIAKALVDNPEEVVVTEKESGKITTIELHVAPSDMGKVIGKQGRIAKAIRAVAKANGANSISIFAPCHRVIGSDRSLTGYGGGLPAKKFLLELESQPRLAL